MSTTNPTFSLSPVNLEAFYSGSVEKLRQTMRRDLTPREQDIADFIRWWMSDLVQTEEAGPYTTETKAERAKRAQDNIDLAMKALRETYVIDLLARRGDIVAHA